MNKLIEENVNREYADIKLISSSEYESLLYKMILTQPTIIPINQTKHISLLQSKIDGKNTSLIVSPQIRNFLESSPGEEYIECCTMKQSVEIEDGITERISYIPLNPNIRIMLFANESISDQEIPESMISDIATIEDFEATVKFDMKIKNITPVEYEKFIDSLYAMLECLDENCDIEFPDSNCINRPRIYVESLNISNIS